MIWNDEQLAIREAARKFAAAELSPHYLEREKLGTLDRPLIRKMGQLGFLGSEFAEEYGGLGAPSVTTGLITEELARGDVNIASMMVAVSLMGTIIARGASPELAKELLPQIVAGDLLCGLGLTEPSTGSDAANIKLRARRDGDDYVISGEKTSITLAIGADAFVVMARTGKPEDRARGVTAFFVPGDAPGLSRTKAADVGGIIQGRGSLFFDDVKVPLRFRLGEEGEGFSRAMVGFDYSRAIIALFCIGAAQASLDEAWEYTTQREAFGSTLSAFQGVTFPLAEADSMLSAVRELSYHALALRDAGLPHTAEAAMVKYLGPKVAYDAIHQSLLTFGHYGCTMETPHQQRLRDVMGYQIGDGTAGIMKMIISRNRTAQGRAPRANA